MKQQGRKRNWFVAGMCITEITLGAREGSSMSRLLYHGKQAGNQQGQRGSALGDKGYSPTVPEQEEWSRFGDSNR